MFFFEQKTAYEMRISDWSSDVCSSDLRFLIEKTRLLDRLRGRINARQEKALIRMMTEGPDGFVGGLSAHNYRTITDAASAPATRDLAELVELGARKSVVWGKSVVVGIDLGGCRIIKKKKERQEQKT